MPRFFVNKKSLFIITRYRFLSNIKSKLFKHVCNDFLLIDCYHFVLQITILPYGESELVDDVDGIRFLSAFDASSVTSHQFMEFWQKAKLK